ncbi:MAG: hypothetical protein ACYC6Y_06750 [Thermoguttaceae bacterium]
MLPPDRVEKLRAQYTDQYVVVDSDLPQLARHKGKIGRVHTINTNGRALVQFGIGDDRGRYDLDLAWLKIVHKPVPKEPPAKPAKAAPKLAAEKPQPAGNLPSAAPATQNKDVPKHG